MFIVKMFGLAVMIYGAARLSSISIKWIKRAFDNLEPKKLNTYEDYDE